MLYEFIKYIIKKIPIDNDIPTCAVYYAYINNIIDFNLLKFYNINIIL